MNRSVSAAPKARNVQTTGGRKTPSQNKFESVWWMKRWSSNDWKIHCDCPSSPIIFDHRSPTSSRPETFFTAHSNRMEKKSVSISKVGVLAIFVGALTGPKIERGQHGDEDECADEAHAEAVKHVQEKCGALEDKVEEEDIALWLARDAAAAARILHLHRLLWHDWLLAAAGHAA